MRTILLFNYCYVAVMDDLNISLFAEVSRVKNIFDSFYSSGRKNSKKCCKFFFSCLQYLRQDLAVAVGRQELAVIAITVVIAAAGYILRQICPTMVPVS